MARGNYGPDGLCGEFQLTRFPLISALVPALILCLHPSADPAFGQPTSGSQPVVIQRRLVRLTPPDAYQFAVSLNASRELTLMAPFDSRARAVSARVGTKVIPQTELLTLDSKRLDLTHQRSIAALEVAEAFLRVARSNGKKEPDIGHP